MPDNTSNERTKEQIRLLTDSRNTAIVSILDDADGPLHLDEVADRVVSRTITAVTTAEYEEKLDRTRISLHHNRLPKLAAVGLVDYDRESNVVTYLPSRSDPIEWQDEIPDALRAHLQTNHDAGEDAIGVIDGRDSIIRHGRRLADEAEDELFCLYVSPDLLEEECVRRGQNAIERGVTMHVGSRNADVRELTRQRLPEATFWEPQLDWMNTSTYPRVGRFVLVDRRKVMLALLDERTLDETTSEETALVGDGADNPLVVLVRELLGPRLDHLDRQGENFRNELLP